MFLFTVIRSSFVFSRLIFMMFETIMCNLLI